MATQVPQLNNLPAPAEQPEQLSYLDNIIDKKVNNKALSCLQTLVDWFFTLFSCCYPSYNERYQDKLIELRYKIINAEVDDIERVEVDGSCRESMPCKHDIKVFLKDGRHASCMSWGDRIWPIVSGLALERINPDGAWDANAVMDHFRTYQNYQQPHPECGLPDEFFN